MTPKALICATGLRQAMVLGRLRHLQQDELLVLGPSGTVTLREEGGEGEGEGAGVGDVTGPAVAMEAEATPPATPSGGKRPLHEPGQAGRDEGGARGAKRAKKLCFADLVLGLSPKLGRQMMPAREPSPNGAAGAPQQLSGGGGVGAQQQLERAEQAAVGGPVWRDQAQVRAELRTEVSWLADCLGASTSQALLLHGPGTRAFSQEPSLGAAFSYM